MKDTIDKGSTTKEILCIFIEEVAGSPGKSGGHREGGDQRVEGWWRGKRDIKLRIKIDLRYV